MTTILFEQSSKAKENGVHTPARAHESDSGFDIYNPQDIILNSGERATIDLQIKIALPIEVTNNNNYYFGIEAQIRPKSGRSKNGLDVELGTIDNGYRGYMGATVTNTTKKQILITKNEKLCQLVFMPILRHINFVSGDVLIDTDRSDKGFGSSGI